MTAEPDDGNPITEYGTRLTSGGYQTWNTEPYMERFAPLAERIELERQHGKVYRRRIIVVEDWAEVGAEPPPVLNVTRDRHCGHCGRDGATAFGWETPLCHTNDPGRPDCYRRVTVYGEPVGALLGDGPRPAGVQGIVGRDMRHDQ